MKRTAIDLFSGCGGLSQGLKSAGFEVIACCEIRAEALQTYALNMPDTIRYPDVRSLKGKKLLSDTGLAYGELDLLAACPPCQGFSSMRTKNREIASDARNELIFEVARLVKELLPKTILIENVPRLLKDQRLDQFKEILAKLGYQFSEGVLDAQNFGVAQRRKRMILIGSISGKLGLPPELPTKKTVRDVISYLPYPHEHNATALHKMKQNFTDKVQERIEKVKVNRSDLPDYLQLECHKRYPKGFRDVYGRIDWDSVAPTITRSSHNPSKGRFIHPDQNRGLTLYEAMLLQGFPKKFKFPVTLGIGKISSMIGEAFPPPMAEAQASHIRRALDSLT
ncbi:MAG: DNA cytosine methyltransferase [Verrucomicrobiota bacterium]